MSETDAKILVVEDQPAEREALMRMLRVEGYEVLEAEDPAAALALIEQPIGVVVSDLKMGHTSGIDLLRIWKKRRPSTPFILVTAYGDVGSAVAAMKLGAVDFLNKPVDPQDLLTLVERGLEDYGRQGRKAELESQISRHEGFEQVIGASPEMAEACEQARRAALTDSTVLITGESGTGKELFAQAIHTNSQRKGRPFITVNMAAVPENLVESELFGHVKGAFTSANDSRAGKFEAASGGTLFIDEIGDFALASQAKLLRVLETQVVTPVGSNEERRVDVRVVTATSRDLEAMIDEGEFRQDLFYRLNVVNLRLPPLRERQGEIETLVNHFLRELCETVDRPQLKVSPELMDYMRRHHWPGNVRQLKNALESMVVLASSDELTLDDLPPTVRTDGGDHDIEVPPDTSLEELERAAVVQALEKFDGNRTRAAESLGISVRTLQRKLKSWGLQDPDHA